MGVSENSGFSPQIIYFNRVFHYKPSILGYLYFWTTKHIEPSVQWFCSKDIAQLHLQTLRLLSIPENSASGKRWGLGSFSAQTKEIYIYISHLYTSGHACWRFSDFLPQYRQKIQSQKHKNRMYHRFVFCSWTPMEIGVDFSTGRRLYFFTRICSNIGAAGFFNNGGCHVCTKQTAPLLLTEEILHQLIGSFSHYLQGFIHPRWLFGISSITSMKSTSVFFLWKLRSYNQVLQIYGVFAKVCEMQPSCVCPSCAQIFFRLAVDGFVSKNGICQVKGVKAETCYFWMLIF